jgi:hypothetical protein
MMQEPTSAIDRAARVRSNMKALSVKEEMGPGHGFHFVRAPHGNR